MQNNQTRNIDLKSQVLNDFLVHRREAIRLKNLGAYWYGLDEFRTLLSGVPLKEENYEEADKIIELIDTIESESYKKTGKTRASREWNQTKFRNGNARRLFNIALRKTTRILQAEGYFDVLSKDYGLSMSELDKITPIET